MKHLSLIVALAFVCTSVRADDANTFKNVTVGFELTKPTEWYFLTAEQHHENLKRLQLGDAEFQAAMLKYTTIPLVAVAKYQEPFDDLNPSFKVNVRPIAQFKDKPPSEILNAIVPQLAKMFGDLVVVEQKQVEVSGLTAGYARFNYSLRVPDGRSFPATSELWIVPRGDYFFMIGGGVSPG